MSEFKKQFNEYVKRIFIDKIPTAFARYGDGERAIICGNTISTNTQAYQVDKWTSSELTLFGKDLYKTLSNRDENYIYGIPCTCCDANAELWYKNIIKNNITFANLWINSNYKSFINIINKIQEDVIIIANKEGINQKYPFNLYKYFPIEDDIVNYYNNNKKELIEKLNEFCDFDNKLVLISAGPLSEIIIDLLWQKNKTNRYIDVGSALDIYIHNKITRPYMVDNNEYSNKTCYFKNFEFNNNINILKEFSDKEQESIPKIIHYCWFGGNELTDLAKRCINSWKLYCPDYKIIRWDESNFDVNSNQFCKEAYDNKKWAFVTDYVRLMVLHNYGGIYMDTDVEIIKPLDNFLKHEAFSGFETKDYVPTGIIAARKNNKWVKLLLDEFVRKKFIIDNKMDMTPNVVNMTKLTKENYSLKLNNEYQDLKDLTLYPTDFFCPKSFITKKFDLTNNTHTIHHFEGSWLPDKNIFRGPFFKYRRNYNLINLINDNLNKELNILEINCLLGENLLGLKDKFQNSNLFGIENDFYMQQILKPYINLNTNDVLFDVIIAINNISTNDIKTILEKYSSQLNNNGKIITTFNYIANYECLNYLNNNGWTIKTTNIKNINIYDEKPTSKCQFNHEFVILSKNNINNIIKEPINSNKKRAITCYIENKEYLINEFYGMYSSIKYINAKDTDIVVFGPKDVLSRIPGDCIKIECNLIYDQQPWSNPKLPFPYKFINSIYFLTIPAANILLNYDYVLKTDVDVFITPEWNKFFSENYAVGKGAYVNNQLTYDKIRSVAKELNLNTKPDYNLGATHYGKPQDIINVMKLTYEVSKYWIENIFIHECGKWPSLWYGVTSMYAGEIAINHLINKVNKISDKIDYNSDSEETLNNQIHIHCYHTDDDFSKFKFRKGEYDNVDISKLDLNIIKDYCLYHILNGQKIKREN